MGIVKYQHLRRLPTLNTFQKAPGYQAAVGRGILFGILLSTVFMSYHVFTAKSTVPEGWEEDNKAYRKFYKLDPIH